jgi:hypothetical protein
LDHENLGDDFGELEAVDLTFGVVGAIFGCRSTIYYCSCKYQQSIFKSTSLFMAKSSSCMWLVNYKMVLDLELFSEDKAPLQGRVWLFCVSEAAKPPR